MITFATDYFLLVFIASIGVLQIAASAGSLSGLLIFKSPLAARALGTAFVVTGFVLFFSTGERNINDYEGGLDANTQALFFFLGTMAGGGVTVVLSSIVNLRMRRGDPSPDSGFEALRDINYPRALARSLIYWWKNWRTQMRRYFSG